MGVKGRLQLNEAKAAETFKTEICRAADTLLQDYLSEIAGAMNTHAGANALRTESSEEPGLGYIHRWVIGEAWAVMDSYGTGSKMDTENSFLDTYRASPLWNPLRHGLAITGRRAGAYTNIFGDEVTSSGQLAGIDLEAFPKSPIRAREPSRAFQDAFRDAAAWFRSGGRMNQVLDAAYLNFLAAVRENPRAYFELIL